MSIPEKWTFRLGELRPAVESRLDETGEKPSAYLRRLIAADCGVEPPKMRGNVAYLRQYAKPKKTAKKRGQSRKPE